MLLVVSVSDGFIGVTRLETVFCVNFLLFKFSQTRHQSGIQKKYPNNFFFALRSFSCCASKGGITKT